MNKKDIEKAYKTAPDFEKEYYDYCLWCGYKPEIAARVSFRAIEDIEAYRKEVLRLLAELIDNLEPKHVERNKGGEELMVEGLPRKELLRAMHYYEEPKQFVDLLFM